jgi:hypothetical protein
MRAYNIADDPHPSVGMASGLVLVSTVDGRPSGKYQR